MQNQISSKTIALTFGVLVILFSAGFYIFAWQEPASAPPAGNMANPINTSATAQTKTGDLTVGISQIKADGSIGTNLNSDKVDSYHAADLMAAGGGGGLDRTAWILLGGNTAQGNSCSAQVSISGLSNSAKEVLICTVTATNNIDNSWIGVATPPDSSPTGIRYYCQPGTTAIHSLVHMPPSGSSNVCGGVYTTPFQVGMTQTQTVTICADGKIVSTWQAVGNQTCAGPYPFSIKVWYR
jgi:hypothetical protein